MYDDFENVDYGEIMKVVDELYYDNKWNFICGGAKIYKYKNQFVKISVANEVDDL